MTSGIVTIIAMLGFIAIVTWVFVIKKKKDFDEQARLPLEEDRGEEDEVEEKRE